MKTKLINYFAAVMVAALLAVLYPGPAGWAQSPRPSDRQKLVYFPGTPNELIVYKIFGRQEGPTIMIIGGIQGDEPGGFLSADLYADLALKRGNLIVVPRANFKSILVSQRGPDGDMNRKFTSEKTELDKDPDQAIVEILKNLMAESDLLLNLHDGSGFYRPEWESELANPNRYGQSIISDTSVYMHTTSGRVINLEQQARDAIALINQDIDEPLYKFHFFNTNTSAQDSNHKEQRKSATYYALTQVGIPAFGVETSKQLPSLEMKIHQHNLAVNAFMEIFGVLPEQPRIHLEPPVLDYVVVSVNDNLPVAVGDGQTLLVAPGDTIEVVHIGANYDRGLSVDVLDLGSSSDIRRPLKIDAPTSIITQKDHIKFGKISVKLLPPDQAHLSPQLYDPNKKVLGGQTAENTGAAGAPKLTGQINVDDDSAAKGPVLGFKLEVGGRPFFLKTGQTLKLFEGESIKLVDIDTGSTPMPKGMVMNLKGFVADQKNNDGQDKGATVDTARDMMPSFSKVKGEKVFDLVAEVGKEALGSATIEIVKLRLKQVSLTLGGQKKILKLGGRLTVAPGTKVTITGVELAGGLELAAPRYTLGGRQFPSDLPQTLTMPSFAVSLAVFEDKILAGKVVLAP